MEFKDILIALTEKKKPNNPENARKRTSLDDNESTQESNSNIMESSTVEQKSTINIEHVPYEENSADAPDLKRIWILKMKSCRGIP